MTDDDLRARLAAIDPARLRGSDEPLPSPSTAEIHALVEHTMDRAAAVDQPARNRWRRPVVLGTVAATVLVAAVVGVGLVSSDRDPAREPLETTELVLSVAPAGTLTSCVPFDVAVLRDMPVAFGGTAAEVRADSVTIDVDRWYTGGSADRVTVSVPGGRTSVALDGVEFTEGQDYLLTATDGTVNGCGFSGPATPELERAFGEAFG